MYFEATVKNGSQSVRENLDNFQELQEFMNKSERRGFVSGMIRCFDQDGIIWQRLYRWTGVEWESVREKKFI